MTQDGPKPLNIFDAASRMAKEHREKATKKEAPAKTAGTAQGSSLSAIFQRCQQMHKEIADTLDQALKKGNISPAQLRAYTSRPQNFSAREWQILEAQKKKNDQLLQNLKNRIGQRAEEGVEVPSLKVEPKKEEERPQPQAPATERAPLTEAPDEELPISPALAPEKKPEEQPPERLPPEEGPLPPPKSPEKPPPPKKPKIVTRRHWIGM